MIERLRFLVLLIAGLATMVSCSLTRRADEPRAPDANPPANLQPSATEWSSVVPGIEWRDMAVPTVSISTAGVMRVVRLDPAVTVLRVHHSPGTALSLAEWRERLPNAAMIVNGSFFDEEKRPLGLLVSDGQSSGLSFSGFGGMLQAEPSGAVRVRSLVGEPYAGEPLWQAVQAFPMLVEAGGVQARQGDGFDVRSRRTWTGQDRAGRLLFGVTPNLISLAELQTWLAESGLDLHIAFALDGGRSSGLFINITTQPVIVQPLDQLPVVIAVYRR